MAAASEIEYAAVSVVCWFVISMEAPEFLQIAGCWEIPVFESVHL